MEKNKIKKEKAKTKSERRLMSSKKDTLKSKKCKSKKNSNKKSSSVVSGYTKKVGAIKFYKNWKTGEKIHPSYEIAFIKGIGWLNLDCTTHPTKSGRYIELDDPLYVGQKDKTYVRKYIRDDSEKDRGTPYSHYQLSARDQAKIDSYISSSNSEKLKKYGIKKD